MAKTIKEMANDAVIHAAQNPAQKEMFSYWYEAGANAVLAEIETCLKEPSMIQGYSDILAKVKELKGE